MINNDSESIAKSVSYCINKYQKLIPNKDDGKK